MKHKRYTEYMVAVASFIAAIVFAGVSVAICEGHEVAAGNCSLVAQFLLLTASIFGIDYKLTQHGHTGHHHESTLPSS